MIVKQGAVTVFPFLMVLASDHITGATGLTPTVTLSKAGAAFGAPAGTVAEIGSGWYKLTPTSADTGTLGFLALHATAATADPVDDRVRIVAYDPDDAVALGLSRLDATVSSRLATSGYTAPLSAGATANAVWDEATSGHVTAGSFGLLVGGLVAAIWANATRTLSAFGFAVTVGTNNDKTGYALTVGEHANITADVPTANANADALLDRAAGVETGLTVRQALRLYAAVLLGKLSGAATTTNTFRDTADSKNRVVATVDAAGDRTAITLDAT